jgi:hypothetical protein
MHVMAVLSCHPSGRGPRRPASPGLEPNFNLMPVIPVTVIERPVPSSVSSIAPSMFAASTKKLQNGHGGDTIAVRGLLPARAGRPERFSEQQQLPQTCSSGFPSVMPLRSICKGGPMAWSKAPEVEDAFCQGCAVGFSAATSLAAVGRSIAPNQGDARQEVRFTTTTIQSMTSSCNKIKEDSQVCGRERQDWHVATHGGIIALDDNFDDDFDFLTTTFEW